MAPEWLQCADTSEQPVVAVAVLPDNLDHTGIVYLNADEQFMFLHLAFHCDLRHESVRESYRWVLPSAKIHPVRLAHVAEMCERVWCRNQVHGLPYGFRYDMSSFRRDGTMDLGLSERGFTCATFVLAVFRTVGVELLQRAEWRARPEDQERFEKLLKLLQNHCSDEVHVNAVRAETTSIRYQPLEVAGGSRHAPLASFANASESATQIRNALASSKSAPTGQP